MIVDLWHQLSSHPFDFFFLHLIPWWLYVAASIASAVIIVFELPTRLGLIVGLGVALVLGDFGFTAKGYHMGTDQANAVWNAQAALENTRLDTGFAKQAEEQRNRADHLMALNATLIKERDDAYLTSTGTAVVIPPASATKLWDIGRPTQSVHPSGAYSAADYPKRPGTIPAMLLPRNYSPIPH